MQKFSLSLSLSLSLLLIFSFFSITFSACGGGGGGGGGNAPANSNSRTMTSFAIVTPSAPGVIDEISKTVTVTVPYGTDITNLVAQFATTGKSTQINGVEQISSVTANDFSSPVIYSVIAKNDTTTEYTVNVNVAQNNSKAITSFSIDGVNATINEAAKTIGVTLSYGTDRAALNAEFATTGVSVKVGNVLQESGVTENDFSSNVIYTVTAADGSTVNYTVAVAVALNSAKDLTSFSINGISGNINQSTRTIGVNLPYDADVTSLVATFTTTGSSVVIKTLGGFTSAKQISGETPNDFTNPVTYTVIAEDGTEKDYTVAVSVASGSAKALTSFSIDGIAGTINESAKTVALTVPYGTNRGLLVAVFSITGVSVKIGSTVQASGGTANDFSSPVVYTVTAEDGSTQNYTVTVTVALNDAKAITAFSISSVNGTIDETAKTITLTVPWYSNMTALTAVFSTTGASVKVNNTVQVSGTTQNDFSSPVVYTVTAEDGTTRNYTVTVTKALSSIKRIYEYSLNGVSGTINTISGLITVKLPVGTDLNSLVAEFDAECASIMVDDTIQVSGVTANDFSEGLIYTLIAEDGTIKNYRVIIELVDTVNQWAKTAINSNYGLSVYYSVKAGSDGSVYAAGKFYQYDGYNFDLGNGVTLPGSTDNYADLLVVKYDYLGNAQWAKTVSGGVQDSMFNAVTDDNAGNIYAAGYINAAGSMDFGNGVNLNTNGWRSVIVKYNSAGATQWVKTVPGAWFFSVATDGNGNVYAAGYAAGSWVLDCGDGKEVTLPSNYYQHVLIVKYSSSGQTLWAKTLIANSNKNSRFNSLAVDSQGNVYAAGEGEGEGGLNFGDDVIAYSTGAFLVKYDPDGFVLWASSSTAEDVYSEVGGWYYIYGSATYYSISIDNDGNIYTAGNVGGSAVSFGNNVIVGSASYGRTVIVKYNSAGVAQWAKTLTTAPETSMFNSVSVDNSGNIYAAGYLTGTSSFDFGNSVTAAGANQGQNSLLVKYNNAGTAQWAKSVTQGPGASRFESVSVNNNGHAYTAGQLTTSGTYYFGDYVNVYKRSSWDDELVIVKYKENYD